MLHLLFRVYGSVQRATTLPGIAGAWCVFTALSIPLVAAAIACARMLRVGLPSLWGAGFAKQSVRVVHWGEGEVVSSWQELRGAEEPLLVRGAAAEQEQLQQGSSSVDIARRVWAADFLLRETRFAEPGVRVRARTMRGGVERVMRYRREDGETVQQGRADALADTWLGLNWTRHSCDEWQMEFCTLADVLQPEPGAFRAVAVRATQIGFVHESGQKALLALAAAVCPSPGCDDHMLWMSSRGLSQQLHFDAIPNIIIHLHGPKYFLLVSPEAAMEDVLPALHPSQHQSQLQWATGQRPAAIPFHEGEELLWAELRPGDALLIPAFWGHQSFTPAAYAGWLLGSRSLPSVSFATWAYPNATLQEVRGAPGKDIGKLRGDVVRQVLAFCEQVSADRGGPPSMAARPAERWAALRSLGLELVGALQAPGLPVRLVESSEEFLRAWETWRWGPQLSAWGEAETEPPSPIPLSLCMVLPPAAVRQAAAAARQLADFLVGWAVTAAPRKVRHAVLRHEVRKILDRLPTYVFPEVWRQMRHSRRGRAHVLALMLRSFRGCGLPS